MNLCVLFFTNFCISMISTCLADNDNLQDACPTNMNAKQSVFFNGLPCKNFSTIVAEDFKSSDLNRTGDTSNLYHFSLNIVTAAVFPGLNTLGLSISRTDIEVDGMLLPHSHPRASEIFFLRRGVALAGFINTNNTLFQSPIKEGDVILFPRGLLHFCINTGSKPVTAYSVLNSQNPGLVSVNGSVFETDTELIDQITEGFISIPAFDRKHISSNTSLAKISRIYTK